MKTRHFAILLLLAFTASLHAAPAFRGQPLMAEAYAKLETALKKVERAGSGENVTPLERAALDLNLAKQALQNAKNNKGASRSMAIKLIEEALPLVEKRPASAEDLTVAKEKITQAMDRVLKGMKVGS